MHIRDDGGLAILYLRRLSELERRVAELEEEVRRLGPEGSAVNAHALHRHEAAPDAGPGAERGGPTELELEGARMVVIEMLSAGYEPAQIAIYLSETFGIDDGEALVEEVGAVRG